MATQVTETHTAQKQEGLCEVYLNHCHTLGVHPNSRLLKELDVSCKKGQTRIDLASNFLGRNGFRAFLEILNSSTKLTSLNLSNNGLDNDAVVALCRVLKPHPSLTTLDLSSNPLSLDAGKAILSILQTNTRLVKVGLDGTYIEERLKERILRKCEYNAKVVPEDSMDPNCPFAKVKAEFQQQKDAVAKDIIFPPKKNDATPNLEAPIARIQQSLESHYSMRVPERDAEGWVILNVYFSTTRSDFLTELDLIHQKIIPSLNKRLASRKVFLHPYAMYYNPEQGVSLHGSRQFTVKDDKNPSMHNDFQRHMEFVDRCQPLYVGLLGDKYGWVPHTLPPNKAFEPLRKHSGQAPLSVLETQYGCLGQPKGTAAVFFLRRSPQHLGVPEGILEAMTDDYNYVHPDPHGPVVVTVDAKKNVVESKDTPDAELLRNRMQLFRQFKEQLKDFVPEHMIVDGYGASFEKVDSHGVVTLKGLEYFEKALEDYLYTIVGKLYQPQEHTAWWKNLSTSKGVNLHSRKMELYFNSLPTLVGRKTVIASLESYLMAPTSRNMMMVVSKPGVGTTAILSDLIRRTKYRRNVVTVSHFVKQGALCDESSDLRSVLLSLCKQMLPEGVGLPPSVANAVSLKPVLEYWKSMLETAVKEPQILCIVIDNLDYITKYPKVPPPIDTAKGAQLDYDEAAVEWPRYDWIPLCLPKNVRLIGSMYEESRTAVDELVSRGVDSCNTCPVPPLDPLDARMLVSHRLGHHGIQLQEDEMDILCLKRHSNMPQYLAILCQLLAEKKGRIDYMTTGTFIEVLPMTIAGLCERTLERAESEVGPEIVRNLCGLMTCSLEGLLELEARELLASHIPRNQMMEGPDEHKLCLEKWGILLNILKPFLYTYYPGPSRQKGSKESMARCINGTDCLLGVNNSTFEQVMQKRYIKDQSQEHEYHIRLAKYYKIKSEKDHPLRVKALRLFPYHMIMAEMFQPFINLVVTLKYIQTMFQHNIGYQLFRMYHWALAKIYEHYHHMKTDPIKAAALETWMERLREFIDFLTASSHVLSSRPALTYQEALITGDDTSTHQEAAEYFQAHADDPYIKWMNKSRARLHNDCVSTCVFSPNGMRILTASQDKGVKISNLVADPIHRTSHHAEVLFARYASTSKYLVVATLDRVLTIYDATIGERLGRCEGHVGQITCADFSKQGRFLVSGSEDRTVKVWETETQKQLTEISHAQYATAGSAFSAVYCVQCHPSEENLFMSACDRTVLVWRLPHGHSYKSVDVECIRTIVAHTQYPVFHIAWSSQASYILTAVRVGNEKELERAPSQDSLIKVWSFATGRVVAKLTGPPSTQPCNSISVSPCYKYIATTSTHRTASIWKVDLYNRYEDAAGVPADEDWECQVLTPFITTSMEFTPTCCGFNHSSRYFAVASGSLLQIWKIPSTQQPNKKPVFSFMTRATISAVTWTTQPSSEGGDLLLSDDEGKVYLLKLENEDEDAYQWIEAAEN